MSGGRSDQIDVPRSLLDLTNRVRALEATPTFFGIKQVDCAIYVGDPVPVSISTGGVQYFIDFGGLSTNAPDTFKLKGGSSPYKASILAGFYYWQMQVVFNDNPPPFLQPNGTDPSILDDFALFQATPVWDARTMTPFTQQWTIVPNASPVPLAPIETVFDGYLNEPADIDDMEANVLLRYVQNTGASIASCELMLARLSNTSLPDESGNIVP